MYVGSGNNSLVTAWSITPDFSRYTPFSLSQGADMSPCQCLYSLGLISKTDLEEQTKIWTQF